MWARWGFQAGDLNREISARNNAHKPECLPFFIRRCVSLESVADARAQQADLGLDLGEDDVHGDAVELATLEARLAAQLGEACAVHAGLGRALRTRPEIGE